MSARWRDPSEFDDMIARYIRGARDVEEYEPGVVRVLKRWARMRGISGQALADEGVPEQALRRAGFRRHGGRWQP